ncbi:MAG TPA: hypothetical protein VK470_02610 [Bacteroidota bacterium]|nr:hypothetical protein [Bacteroidota bacterium]
MKQQAGLWIDHKKAVIVTLTSDGEEITHFESDIIKTDRISGSADTPPAESPRNRRFTEGLNRYYDSLLAYLRDKVSILIMGPGKAKIEFQKKLETQALSKRIVEVEPAEKMTDRQIAARVRKHFQKA